MTVGARRLGGITILLCFLVALIEGFDIQSAGVAAPKLAAALRLGPNALGLVFTASTAGMLMGAYVGGLLSDRFGRKPVLLFAVTAFGVFSLLSGFSHSLQTLLVARLFTGMGLGAALPALIALAAENNPARHGRAVALMYAGLPLGGAFAGVLSALTPRWETIFHIGGLLPILVLPALALFLTESVRRVEPSAGPRSGKVSALLAHGRLRPTLLLWLAFFSAMLVFYLMLNWTPMLLSSRGFAPPHIALFQAALNIAGSVAVMIASSVLDGPRKTSLAIGAYLLTLVALGLVAWMPQNTLVVLCVAGALGAGLLTSQSILYATAPALYDDAVRGQGVGTAVAVGRMGSVVGPMLAAVVLSFGMAPAALIALTVPIFLVAGLANIAILRRQTGAGLS